MNKIPMISSGFEKMQEEIKDKKDLESIKEKIDKGSETVEKKTKAAVEEI